LPFAVRTHIGNGLFVVGVRGFEPPTAGTQSDPGMGSEPRHPWKTSESEPAASWAEALDTSVVGLVSDTNVQMKALLNRALASMPEGQARELVLAAVRLLDDEGLADEAKLA